MSQITAAELAYVKGLAAANDAVAIRMLSLKDELNSVAVTMLQDYRTGGAGTGGVAATDLANHANAALGSHLVGVQATNNMLDVALAAIKATADAARPTAYVPGTAGNWAGSPATIQAAIDRLAAAVEGLLAVPIP